MLGLSAATILGALAFEHFGGYQPCALCLMQRTPYYLGVPLAAAWGTCARAPLRATRWAAYLFGDLRRC